MDAQMGTYYNSITLYFVNLDVLQLCSYSHYGFALTKVQHLLMFHPVTR